MTKTTVELIRESKTTLPDWMVQSFEAIAARVFDEKWDSVPAEEFDEPEILAPGSVSMDALRSICAGNVVAQVVPGSGPVVPCGFESFNDVDGEVYRCSLPQHDFKVKHGGWVKV